MINISDDAAIRELVDAFVTGWNSGDGEACARPFAVIVNPSSLSFQNRVYGFSPAIADGKPGDGNLLRADAHSDRIGQLDSGEFAVAALSTDIRHRQWNCDRQPA